MRVVIKSIEAELANTSSVSEDSFIITYWVVKYEIIVNSNYPFQDMTGKLMYRWKLPPMKKIIKQIRGFYDSQRPKK